MAADKTDEEDGVADDPQTYRVIGAAMEVHRILGTGFLEPVYQEALAAEFEDQGIPHERECCLDIGYKGKMLRCQYRADFICFNDIIIETKAIDRLGTNEDAQVLNYLKATGLQRALLINFGQTRLQYRRLVRSHSHHLSSSF